MALGSPVGSPSPSTPSNYLPSYLMGESNIAVAPRSNTLSPTKGRSLAFGGASAVSPVSPTNEFNRSILQQRSQFGGYQPSPPSNRNHANQSQVNHHNVSVSGPPTQVSHGLVAIRYILINRIYPSFHQGLFDSLRSDNNAVADTVPNASYNQVSSRQFDQSVNQSIFDSFLNQSDLNCSR